MVSSSVRPCRVKIRAPVSDKSVMIPSMATASPPNVLIRTGSAGEKRGKPLHSSCVGTVMATALSSSRESDTGANQRDQAPHLFKVLKVLKVLEAVEAKAGLGATGRGILFMRI